MTTDREVVLEVQSTVAMMIDQEGVPEAAQSPRLVSYPEGALEVLNS